MEGNHAGSEEDYEEEVVAERTCDELTAIPIPHLPYTTQVQEVEILRVKLSLKRWEE